MFANNELYVEMGGREVCWRSADTHKTEKLASLVHGQGVGHLDISVRSICPASAIQ